MKRQVMILTVMFISGAVYSQRYVQGTIQKGSSGNKVDVVYLPNHSTTGEYVNYLSVSIAIPSAEAPGVAPTIATTGIFSPLSFVPAVPFSYTTTVNSEPGGAAPENVTVYSWICSNATPFAMSWSNGVSFVGATITFTGGASTSKVRLIDFSNLGGGTNGNTFFNVGVNLSPFDLTNYSDFFFTIGGSSTESAFDNGDQYAETVQLVSLPVSLINFSGYKSGSKNVLKWTTATEQNSRGFDVQRSGDGVSYSSIGYVNSRAVNGNSTTELNYSFDDSSPLVSKKNYYRLRQVDTDSRSKLSNVVVISGDKPKIAGIGGIFPNPASQLINVIVESPQREDVTMVVMDVSGKTIKQKLVNVEMGSNTVPVEIGNLASGSYLVKVISRLSEGESAVSKFVKQ